MSELSRPRSGGARRRADAQRSIAGILNAAVEVLNRRPEASLEEVAAAAGVTRQTVYAHYSSRAALLDAAIDRASSLVLTAMDEAQLDQGPPADVLIRVVDAGWRTYRRYSRLLAMSPPNPETDAIRHETVRQLIERLVKRGQRTGDFDPHLSSAWLTTVAIALSHAIADDVATGRVSAEDAPLILEQSILRVFSAAPA